MTTEHFSLSNWEIEVSDPDILQPVYFRDDVKDFIKKLKEETHIKGALKSYKECIENPCEYCKLLNKLAGDKLIFN